MRIAITASYSPWDSQNLDKCTQPKTGELLKIGIALCPLPDGKQLIYFMKNVIKGALGSRTQAQ